MGCGPADGVHGSQFSPLLKAGDSTTSLEHFSLSFWWTFKCVDASCSASNKRFIPWAYGFKYPSPGPVAELGGVGLASLQIKSQKLCLWSQHLPSKPQLQNPAVDCSKICQGGGLALSQACLAIS